MQGSPDGGGGASGGGRGGVYGFFALFFFWRRERDEELCRNCVFPNLTLAVGFRVGRRRLVLAVKLILSGHLWFMRFSFRYSQSSPWISEEIQNGHITLIT